jgi:hypothetical protein
MRWVHDTQHYKKDGYSNFYDWLCETQGGHPKSWYSQNVHQLKAKEQIAKVLGRTLSGPEFMDVHVHEALLIKTNTTEL